MIYWPSWNMITFPEISPKSIASGTVELAVELFIRRKSAILTVPRLCKAEQLIETKTASHRTLGFGRSRRGHAVSSFSFRAVRCDVAGQGARARAAAALLAKVEPHSPMLKRCMNCSLTVEYWQEYYLIKSLKQQVLLSVVARRNIFSYSNKNF